MGKSVASTVRRLRCAIYTRKSSEEGLDQAFNSLDAQREACDAYIKSQQHEGWVGLPMAYDDGGKSGATLVRPALQQLLRDIEQRRLDIIVVYKVDRLTRSLADFAKLVEVFDQHQVSFVSVTQQFNTTTSMGRLTLNVLLSFAQFEREVTAERIRDKIAASKQKGLWMGGLSPLGYDVRDRALVVNAAEAETVRFIFQRYLDLGSVQALKTALDSQGIVNKQRPPVQGQPRGGQSLGRGALYRLLSNPLYRGRVAHKDLDYPGQHPAIIEAALWDAVQQQLTTNQHQHTHQTRAAQPSLLTGLVFDGEGRRLTPSHAVKRGRRYRYYCSQALTTRPKDTVPDGLRFPAFELERAVTQLVGRELTRAPTLSPVLSTDDPTAATLARRLQTLADVAERWSTTSMSQQRARMLTLLMRVIVRADRVSVHLNPDGVRAMADDADLNPCLESARGTNADNSLPWVVDTAIRLKQVRGGLKLVLHADTDALAPNPALVKLLQTAHHYRTLVEAAEVDASMKTLAARAHVSDTYFTAVLRFAWLAPDLTHALLEGRHAPDLTVTALMRHTAQLPLAWSAQREFIQRLSNHKANTRNTSI